MYKNNRRCGINRPLLCICGAQDHNEATDLGLFPQLRKGEMQPILGYKPWSSGEGGEGHQNKKPVGIQGFCNSMGVIAPLAPTYQQ